MTMRNGRMSCEEARELSMTKMFYFFNNSMAGSLSGKFNGMYNRFYRFYDHAKLAKSY